MSATKPVFPDDFNLLPYRYKKRRALRQRRLAVLIAASVAGGAALGAVVGWDAFERARLDAERATLETSLRASNAQVDEHARLTRAEAERRRARQQAQPLAAPRDRFLALLHALADTPPERGIALQRVSQRTDEVELAAFAPDSPSAARWLKRLEDVAGVQSVEVIEMKRRADTASAVPERYEFTALVRYPRGAMVANGSNR
ncbi:Type IV pilus biogeneis protein PilN [Candidatus Burkholderia verschuerenii]|uniref:Type IV pilus biogeneis protein PilN n=1 Tax=Candidatus Burkholderia verschuerenii TaxID=242163 RepID=A0A0L0MFG5_9BURK|nr:PilN domain-containing protein [Candidatus Burkholderia verschuerenii]KND61025.1 Type IV pilus biogeneis protein PilN [Candidatus Burkholderia verschuerenii]